MLVSKPFLVCLVCNCNVNGSLMVRLLIFVSVESFDILGQLGRTPSYMKLPPKEHLLETVCAFGFECVVFHLR